MIMNCECTINSWLSKFSANNVFVFMKYWQYQKCGLHSFYLLSFFGIYKWYNNG